MRIGNFTTQTTFYSSYWERNQFDTSKPASQKTNEFIVASGEGHLKEINTFKIAKRQNIKYKAGDIFAFKLNRTEYGFGRILLDINKLRKKKLLSENHGMQIIMGTALLINVYAFTSKEKTADAGLLNKVPVLPSHYIMDNHLFYGEYEIIGHKEVKDTELEFPISYGESIRHRNPNVFLQWGFIHKEQPLNSFNKFLYIEGSKQPLENPYGNYGIGFSINYTKDDIVRAIQKGSFDFDSHEHYTSRYDLRNPKNEDIKREIFKAFELNPDLGYLDNCNLTDTNPIIRI